MCSHVSRSGLVAGKPMQTSVVHGWRCRYDLQTGKFDAPALFSDGRELRDHRQDLFDSGHPLAFQMTLILYSASEVRFWHKADICFCTANVRFRG